MLWVIQTSRINLNLLHLQILTLVILLKFKIYSFYIFQNIVFESRNLNHYNTYNCKNSYISKQLLKIRCFKVEITKKKTSKKSFKTIF